MSSSAPEVSIASLISQHKTTVQRQQDQNDRTLRQVALDADALGSTCVRVLNHDLCRVYTTQQTIDNTMKHLQTEVERTQSQMDQWTSLFVQINEQLKELGDVKNWAGHMQRDMEDIITCVSALQDESGNKKDSGEGDVGGK
eukprot:PhM_4_TR17875/c0_g1_i1/m.11064/K20185/BLOC1S1; biogenesis of lysosome-related organelles complex 1 subunit 1